MSLKSIINVGQLCTSGTQILSLTAWSCSKQMVCLLSVLHIPAKMIKSSCSSVYLSLVFCSSLMKFDFSFGRFQDHNFGCRVPWLDFTLLHVHTSMQNVTSYMKTHNYGRWQYFVLKKHSVFRETGGTPQLKTRSLLFGRVSSLWWKIQAMPKTVSKVICFNSFDHENFLLHDSHGKIVITCWINLLSFVQVIDDTPTNSYLDDCLFNQMVEYTRKYPEKPRSAEKWILQGSNFHKPSCVSATFDSLVKLGLLGKVSKLFGTNYPTLNPGITVFMCCLL